MVTWNNLDTLASFQNLQDADRVNLAEVMSGENGADRVRNYSIPMAAGLAYNYAAKQVDDNVLTALAKLAEEAQLAEKFKALYNGEVINTGEKRLVLHIFSFFSTRSRISRNASKERPTSLLRIQEI